MAARQRQTFQSRSCGGRELRCAASPGSLGGFQPHLLSSVQAEPAPRGSRLFQSHIGTWGGTTRVSAPQVLGGLHGSLAFSDLGLLGVHTYGTYWQDLGYSKTLLTIEAGNQPRHPGVLQKPPSPASPPPPEALEDSVTSAVMNIEFARSSLTRSGRKRPSGPDSGRKPEAFQRDRESCWKCKQPEAGGRGMSEVRCPRIASSQDVTVRYGHRIVQR